MTMMRENNSFSRPMRRRAKRVECKEERWHKRARDGRVINVSAQIVLTKL